MTTPRCYHEACNPISHLLRTSGIGVPQVAFVAPRGAVPGDTAEAAAASHLGLPSQAPAPLSWRWRPSWGAAV